MGKTAMKMLSAIIALSCAGASATLNLSADNSNQIIYGDANCDEAVDIRDVASIKKHVVKISALSEKGVENCDFFGNGEISVKNLGQLVKYSIMVIDKLEPVYETNEEVNANFSVVYLGSPACEFEGIKVYKSADELHKDFTTEDFEKYDEKYFSENVLCIKPVVLNSAVDDVIVDIVEKDEDGNFIVNILEIFNESIHTDAATLGYTVCMEISADEYTGQDFEIKVSAKTGAVDYNFAISDYGMCCYDKPTICTTYDELCAFIDENYHPWPDGGAESETLKMYDEKFFEDNVLFISGYSENFGMMQPAFDYISVTDEEITLGMIRDYSMEYCVEDLNGCIVSFSMSKDEYKGQKFVVKSKNINQNDSLDYYFNTTDYSSDEPDNNIAPVICTSYEELTKYVDEYISANPNTIQDSKALLPKMYNEEFFEEYVLCVGRVGVARGKREVNFNSVEYVDDSIILLCDRDKSLKADDTYKSCFVSVAVSRDTYKGQKDFRIGFTDETNTEKANPANPFTIQMSHDYYQLSDKFDKPYVITSYEEFKEYTDSFEIRVYLTDDSVTDVSMSAAEELFKKYNAEFFESNVLFVRGMEFGSDCCLSENSVTKDENGNFILNVELEDYMLDGLIGYFVGFELAKSEYNGQTFTVNVEEKKQNTEKANPTNEFTMEMGGGNYYLYEKINKPCVITSYQEFEEYTYSFERRAYLTDDSVTHISMSAAEELFEKYNAEFFESNVLFVEGIDCGGCNMSAKSVIEDRDGNFILNIDAEYIPSIVPTAYFAGFELAKSEYNGQTFTVNIEEKKIQEEPEIYNFISVMTGYNSDYDLKYGEVLRKNAYTSAEEFQSDYPGVTKYDEEFFKDNVLYITPQSLPSGSMKAKGKSVEKDENGNFIINIYGVAPFIGTCDMSGCIVGFELPRSEYNGQTLEKVVRYDVPYEYYDEAYKGETEGELISGDLIDIDDDVNIIDSEIYNTASIYDAKTIKSADELKYMVNENADEAEKSALLEKYNEEFFKSYDIAVVKFAGPEGVEYLAENAAVIGGYYDGCFGGYYANVQICTSSFGGSDKAQDNCIILKFAKKDDVRAVNVKFTELCID